VRTDDSLNWVECLNWDQVASRIANGASAILPVGAGAKEHGFHLPMGTDRIQAEALAARLSGQIDALVWPTLSYGYYPAFSEYAGSCSLSVATFEALIEDITTALLGYGCKSVFVLDTGLSTISPIERALARIASEKTCHLRIHDGAKYKTTADRIAQQKFGSHADELETSLMLALAPDAVDMTLAEASPVAGRDASGPLTPFDSSSPNYSASGSFGDPAYATRAKGELLLAAMTDDLVERALAFLAGNLDSVESGESTS
jgi:creatinine amidohydrolase